MSTLTTLNGLSDEALELILEWSCLGSLLLWQSGDPLLRKRIVRVCRAVRIQPSASKTVLLKWPRMFSELPSLRLLHVHVTSCKESIDSIASHLATLPSTLSEISLQFEGASRLPGIIIPKTLWPQLVKAQIRDPPQAIPNHFARVILKDHVDIWPESLEELCLGGALPDSTRVSFQMFPRGLKRLSFFPGGAYGPIMVGYSLDTLPPNLTHLDGINSHSLEAMMTLPRSLERGNFIGQNSGVDVEWFAALPPLIRTITGPVEISQAKFESVGISWTTLVPKSVNYLNIKGRDLTTTEIGTLPRGLTSLQNTSINESEFFATAQKRGLEELLKFWPPLLTDISFQLRSNSEPMKSSNLNLLPASLKMIGGLYIAPETNLFDHLSDLPSGLTHLDITWPSRSRDQELPNTLPAGLTFLRLSQVFLSPPSLSNLPSSLIRLALVDTSIQKAEHAQSLLQVPSGLQYLAIANVIGEAFSSLPPNLSYLTVRSIVGPLPSSPLPASLTRVKVLRGRNGTTVSENPIFVYGSPWAS